MDYSCATAIGLRVTDNTDYRAAAGTLSTSQLSKEGVVISSYRGGGNVCECVGGSCFVSWLCCFSTDSPLDHQHDFPKDTKESSTSWALALSLS